MYVSVTEAIDIVISYIIAVHCFISIISLFFPVSAANNEPMSDYFQRRMSKTLALCSTGDANYSSRDRWIAVGTVAFLLQRNYG